METIDHGASKNCGVTFKAEEGSVWVACLVGMVWVETYRREEGWVLLMLVSGEGPLS